ncbi:MAG TPA: sigma-70 family RNA polymerase sigma factor [Thermoanaerobaculia bacterium]|nr:sigma-70 family RNA polymerase sigma factor [Thermoanaerobaculia bacterium]
MERILIVDDETPLAEALSELFETENITAATAGDRADAERMMLAEHFPVIIADVRLRNEEEGLMLLESIRRLSPRSKIATMTGYATPALEQRLRSLGARQILYKPFEFDELLRVVRELLGDDDPAGEELDLDELHEQMRAVLFSFPMRRFGLAAHDAEDVVQQAWCLFLEKRDCIRQPRAWLSGTVANLCRQRLDDRHRMIPTEAAILEDIADARARAADAAIAVHTALAAADERSRQLCFLIGLENRSYEEVSARLGIPVGSVGPLYIRAKAKMRKLLAN